jgi:tetratricopeptide (TPR) repeat protein
VGKTALALEVGWRYVDEYAELPPAMRFDAIVWAATGPDMLPRRRGASRASRRLQEVHNAIATVLNDPNLLRTSPDKQAEQAIQALERAERVLLILDDLDRADDLPFLRDVPAPSMVLVTTRFADDYPRPIRLGALDPRALGAIIRQASLEERLRLSEREVAELSTGSGGLPLVALWALGLGAGERVRPTLGTLRVHPGDVLYAVFGQLVDHLRESVSPPGAYRVLKALTFFDPRDGASAKGLAETCNLTLGATEQALSRLLTMHLVERLPDTDAFTMLPVARSFMRVEVEKSGEWEDEARRRWVTFYLNLVAAPDTLHRLGMLRHEIGNLLAVMDWLSNCERISATPGLAETERRQRDDGKAELTELAHLFRDAQGMLYAAGRWQALGDYAQYLAAGAARHGWDEVLILTLRAPIDIYARWHWYRDGHTLLAFAQRAFERSGNPQLRAETLLARARLVYDDGTMDTRPHLAALDPPLTFERVLAELEEAIGIFRQHQRHERVMQALNTLGNCYRWGQKLDAASARYDEALRLFEDAGPGAAGEMAAWRPVIEGNLGLVLGRRGKHAEACAKLLQARQGLTVQTDLIEVNAALALYTYRLGDQEGAKPFREEADRLKKVLHLKLPVCKEDAEWEQEQEQEHMGELGPFDP